mgnify:CR=1 FL=1
MIVETIHEQPSPPADRLEHAAGLAFIRDGFSISAAVFAPLWMLFNGAWIGTLVYVAASTLLATLFSVVGWDIRWFLALIAAAHFIVGFEASSLRRWSLERKGWRLLGTVAGRNVEECERRFFDSWLPPQRPDPGTEAPSGSLAGMAATGGNGNALPFARLRRLVGSS